MRKYNYKVFPANKITKYFYTEKRAEAYKKFYAIIKK